MIITDKNARPSERFIEVIKHYFLSLGYSYKKSDKTFIKIFDRGFYEVGFWFRISTLTDVSLHWSIQLTKFEKIAALIRKERLTKSNHTLRLAAAAWRRAASLPWHIEARAAA